MRRRTNEKMGVATWEDVDRAFAAYARAETCCRCGNRLPADGPVRLMPCRLAWEVVPGLAVTRDVLAAGCPACVQAYVDAEAARFAPDPHRPWLHDEKRWPAWSSPCPGCGRTVHLPPNESAPTWLDPREPYCSNRCRNRVYGARFRRRHPRPKVARPVVACRTCGRSFAPRRSDARTCSPACRQKAYRERAAVTADGKGNVRET
jgi:hypothetical protein